MKTSITLAAALLATSIAAAERVTVDGQAYEISTVVGTYEQHKALLAKQPWFGHQALAREFLFETYGVSTQPGVRRDGIFNFPNTGGNVSWHFAYFDKTMPDGRTVPGGSAALVSDPIGCTLDGSNGEACDYWPKPQQGAQAGYDTSCHEYAQTSSPCYWAIATPVANQAEPFSVLPKDGNYPIGGTFDIEVTGITSTIDHITSVLNGNTISNLIASCWKQKTPTSISCDGVKWSDVGPGQHVFEVYLDLSNGQQHYESVTWTVY